VDDLGIFKDADAVFHLAAEIYVQKSLEFPNLFTEVNETGTKNILDHCVQNNIKNVVFSSTASVYGNSPTAGSKETDTVSCSNIYSISKWNAEQICLTYTNSYGMNITALRYSNVYGHGQDTSSQYAPALGRFLDQKSKGEPLTVVGDGLQKRDFINVQDVVEANYAAYLNNHGFNVYNVGFGNSLSILDLAKSISSDITFLPPRDGEWRETNVDITKIKDYLGWYPKVNIQDWITNG
jgi:UDP-glucose 4-epimerase